MTSILTLAACGEGGGLANQDDHDALVACGSAACGSSAFAQRIELGDPFSMYGMECILQGMRDRQSAVYKPKLSYVWTSGGISSTFSIFVTPSGEAEVAVLRGGRGEDGTETELEPTKRCTLRPAAFFEACLVDVQAVADAEAEGFSPPDGSFDCVYPVAKEGDMTQELPWFESCETQSPTCE